MQIEENQRQKQIITGEYLPLCSLSLIKKIILIILTTDNNSLNLAHCLLMAFSNLEKQKNKNYLEKHFTGARANIEQNPYGAS